MTVTNHPGSAAPGEAAPRFRRLRNPIQRGFRSDIQALRALAVGLVVLNHLWPNRVSGGYVGVDVFFVISGFLITSHLTREIFRTGKIRLFAFYARRIRRLLPAAFLVLGVSLVVTWLVLPYAVWTSNVQEILGATFYVENWLLAAKSVDYSSLSASATLVQHYWSLSVEEQFYFVWPLILIATCFLGLKLRVRPGLALARVFIVAVFISLIASVYITSVAHNQAYFVTPVRVWEFGLGALVAVAVPKADFPLVVRNLLALAGFLMILMAAATFSSGTFFPGWTALIPTVGTAFVIMAGNDGDHLWHERVTGWKPIQFVGNISYSIYLWHWPMVVSFPFIIGSNLSFRSKFTVGIASIAAAWVTKKLVEDRWIQRGYKGGASKSAFIFLGAGMMIMILAGTVVFVRGNQLISQAQATTAQLASNPCFGPAAVGSQPECGNPFTTPVTVPNMGPANAPWTFPADCPPGNGTLENGLAGSPMLCDFSGGDGTRDTVWIVGDSHAQQWETAIFDIARSNHWKVKWSYRGGCPVVDASFGGFNGAAPRSADAEKCETWSRTTFASVAADKPKKVFISEYWEREKIDDGTRRPQIEQYVDGLARDWKRWADLGIGVYPIVEPPANAAVRSVDCLTINATKPQNCAVDRSLALAKDPMTLAARKVNSSMVHIMDFTRFFCDEKSCYSAVGGLPVYYDTNHLNDDYVRHLIPYFIQTMR